MYVAQSPLLMTIQEMHAWAAIHFNYIFVTENQIMLAELGLMHDHTSLEYLKIQHCPSPNTSLKPPITSGISYVMSFSKGRRNNTTQLYYQWVHWITRVWIFKPLLDFKTSYLHEDLFVLNFHKLSLMPASIRLATTYHLVPYGETTVWRKMKKICPKMTHSWRYNCSSGYFRLKIERMWETPQVPMGPSQTHHSQTIHRWWYISRCGFFLK